MSGSNHLEQFLVDLVDMALQVVDKCFKERDLLIQGILSPRNLLQVLVLDQGIS